MDATDATIDNRLRDAIQEILEAHLDDYLSDFVAARVHWHREIKHIKAVECPVIGIYNEDGWDKQREWMRGRDAAGDLYPSLAQRRYPITIHIFLKGRKETELERSLRLWTGAITACLEYWFSLDDMPVDLLVSNQGSAGTFSTQSAILGAGEVRIQVDSWTSQSAVAYP